jgi:hypothetical protein
MQQVANWLEKLGMSEYAQRFADNVTNVAVRVQALAEPGAVLRKNCERLARKQAEDQVAEANVHFHAALHRGYARYISEFPVGFDPLQGFVDACCNAQEQEPYGSPRRAGASDFSAGAPCSLRRSVSRVRSVPRLLLDYAADVFSRLVGVPGLVPDGQMDVIGTATAPHRLCLLPRAACDN